VVFQVNNLTDEPFITYTGDDARHVRDYQNYGRNFMLGANYKF
jgi:iron complex outermembrane receptor protein